MKSKNITFSRRLTDHQNYIEGIYQKRELQLNSHYVQLTLTQNSIQMIFNFNVHLENQNIVPVLADRHQDWAAQHPELLLEMSNFAQAIIDFYVQKDGYNQYLIESEASMA